METQPYLQRLGARCLTPILPARQLSLYAQGGTHRSLRMIFLGHRSAKDDQDTIASDRPAHPPILLGLRVHQLIQVWFDRIHGGSAPHKMAPNI